MLLAHYLPDVRDVVLGGHEVGEVVELKHIVASGDDGVDAPFDGHHVVGLVGAAYLAQRSVEYLAAFAQLDAQHDECSVVDIPSLAHPRHLQAVDNVFSGQRLGVDYRVDTHLAEQLLVVGKHIFVGVYARHGALCPQPLGQRAGHDVLVLVGGDGNEQVGSVGSGMAQGVDTRRRGFDGKQVEVAANLLEVLGIVVDERYVILVAREQLGKVCSDGVGTGYDNLHFCIGPSPVLPTRGG